MIYTCGLDEEGYYDLPKLVSRGTELAVGNLVFTHFTVRMHQCDNASAFYLTPSRFVVLV
jgi:hypothetical protein